MSVLQRLVCSNGDARTLSRLLRARWLWVPLGLLACRSTGDFAGGWTSETWIHRDRFGVPHVESSSDAGAVYGWMYARAEDEFEKVEQACFLTLGRNAEHLGEEGLSWDRLVLALQIPSRARAKYEHLPSEVRELCDAAAAAMNHFAARHPERGLGLIEEFEPWHFVAQSYSWHLFQAAQTLREELGEVIGLGAFAFPEGSNAWAVAPQRTKAGYSLLLINPHMALDAVFEGQLISEQGLHLTGAAPFGRNLLPLYGHNEGLAWALTVNHPDVVDLYSLICLDDEGGMRHQWQGVWQPLESRSVEVRVRDGSELRPRTLTFYDSPLGPLVAQRGATQVAIAVSGLEDNRFLETHYALARARDLDEVKAALGLGGWIFHNVVVATNLGDIWYVYGGRMPRRGQDVSFRGTRAAQGPEDRWQGFHPIEELPQVQNPPSGWIQNCNSDPFATSADGNPARGSFPTYLVGEEDSDGRSARSRTLLSQSGPLSFDRLSELAFDTGVGSADVWIEQIREALARRLEVANSTHSPSAELQQAWQALEAWDHQAHVDSVPTTLFFLWFERYMTFVRANRRPPTADRVLEEVVHDLQERNGTWQVPWGQINRLQRPGSPTGSSWPVPGGHGAAGIQATFLSVFPQKGAPARLGTKGSGYVSVVELSSPPRSRSILPYGQSSQPHSAHFEDQAPLYAAGRMKENPFRLEDVRSKAVRSYRPGGR